MLHMIFENNGTIQTIPLQIFFIFISLNIQVPLILHTKFQPNVLSQSGKNVDFNGFAIF